MYVNYFLKINTYINIWEGMKVISMYISNGTITKFCGMISFYSKHTLRKRHSIFWVPRSHWILLSCFSEGTERGFSLNFLKFFFSSCKICLLNKMALTVCKVVYNLIKGLINHNATTCKECMKMLLDGKQSLRNSKLNNGSQIPVIWK